MQENKKIDKAKQLKDGIETIKKPGAGWKAMNFAKVVYNDDNLLREYMALKGSLGLVALGIYMVASIAAMPFLLAAGAIGATVACVALGGYGIYSSSTKVVNSAKKVWNKFTQMVYEHIKKENNLSDEDAEKHNVLKPEKVEIKLSSTDDVIRNKISSNKVWRKTADSKLFKKAKSSSLGRKTKLAWEYTKAIFDNNLLLNNLAVTGSVMTVVFGTVFLLSQIAVLPIVMVATLLVTSGANIASGVYAMYSSTKETVRGWKKVPEKISNKRQELIKKGLIEDPSQSLSLKKDGQKAIEFNKAVEGVEPESNPKLEVALNDNQPVSKVKKKGQGINS